MWFQAEKLSVCLIDVGGDRSQRRKWLHCFESVDAILFVSSLSEYNQTLAEDPTVNRMDEAVKLFKYICNVRWFLKASLILFFNKTDVFEQKIRHSPISEWCPEFKEPNCKEAATTYISKRFTSLNCQERSIYTHFTCAKDSENIFLVFTDVTDMLIEHHLKNTGLV